jgi:hypothetical protein
MRKVFLLLSAALIALSGPVFAIQPAAASGPSLTCNIQPSNNDNFTTRCSTTRAVNTYTLDYLVQGGTGTYTYAWTYPEPSTVLAGCTSTNPDCEISVFHGSQDDTYTATVVLTQNGTHTTLTASAFIPAVCPPMFC